MYLDCRFSLPPLDTLEAQLHIVFASAKSLKAAIGSRYSGVVCSINLIEALRPVLIPCTLTVTMQLAGFG